jgi:thiaminase/transcriptional activator TenA
MQTRNSRRAEYAGAPYQEVAAKARAHLEGLADLYVTPAREAELIVIFKEATRLEADFWKWAGVRASVLNSH